MVPPFPRRPRTFLLHKQAHTALFETFLTTMPTPVPPYGAPHCWTLHPTLSVPPDAPLLDMHSSVTLGWVLRKRRARRLSIRARPCVLLPVSAHAPPPDVRAHVVFGEGLRTHDIHQMALTTGPHE